MRNTFFLMLAAAAVVAGCAQMRQEEPAVASSTYTYSCGKGGPVGTVTFVQSDPETVVLASGGQSVELVQVPAASGARYEHPTEEYLVWNQGDRITLNMPGSPTYTCSLDPAA